MKIQGINSVANNNRYNTKPNFKRAWNEHVSWGANYIKETGKTNFKLFSFPDAKAVFVEVADKAAVGLDNIKNRLVQLLVSVSAAGLVYDKAISADKNSKTYIMENKGDGIFEAKGIDAKPEDKYRYIVIDGKNNINLVKDPYSKQQDNINGWSAVYNSDNYEWKNTDWLEGKDQRRIVRDKKAPMRGLERLVIDEINIPTLSEEGTFDAAITKIDKIAEDGIATAIELLPVENTYSLQWGYDGVDKFAVNPKMGGAAKLKAFIDHAHGKGLNVIMDMVPNHMGPDGDYLTQTGPYEKGAGQFGGEFNYEGKHNKYVRDWMANAALWWANEFKVDGIRLDMTKMCGSDYLLKQIVSEVNEHNPNIFLIAEDARENKESVTRYEVGKPDHETELNLIDMSVDIITNSNWLTTPGNIGFDSEWDFRFMHTLKNAIIGGTNLDALDDRIKGSAHRVKYVMSHDEIGNEDGTRLISKVMSRNLDLYNKIDGISEADKGQKAAQAGQKLAELVVSKEFENLEEKQLELIEQKIGLNSFIDKETLLNTFNTAIAKQKLAQGTVMTIPGPKMYFQGDEEADLSHFKFFREFSDEKDNRALSDDFKNRIVAEKGYDTLESAARPDCIVGRVKPDGMFKNVQTQMKTFNKDLADVVNSNPALLNGEIIGTFKDYTHGIHTHHLKKDNNEILVIKHFGQGFYDKNYEYFGFPENSKWSEIFSSDLQKYGGSGFSNDGRNEISKDNQGISLAPNSFVILKKIS